MSRLQRLSGISAIFEAVIYVVAFTYFGAFWAYPSEGSALEQISYLADNQLMFSAINCLMYLVFGVFLAVLVVGLHEKLKNIKTVTISIGSLFGAIWVGLVIASGMVSNIGLSFAIDLMASDPQKALDTWAIVNLITESLGGGNELVGGLWVLLISIGALSGKVFSKALNYLGIFVGIAGISTVYPADILTELFGVTQIVWFVSLGISLLRQANNEIQPTPKGSAAD